MAHFLDRVLDPPSYGYTQADGTLYRPSNREIYSEFFARMNVFRSRKNWLTAFGWVTSASLAIPLYLFFTRYFSLPLFVLGFVYSMMIMGSHGTMWLHRYSTHRAFQFKNAFYREVARNLVIRILAEEIYALSHHVHHRFPEKPGDPYNVHGGALYCFFSDAIHQMVNPNLNEKDYQQVCKLMEHTGVRLNTYAQYQRWGSLCHPFYTVTHFFLNWGFWYGTFYLLGGNALATAMFGMGGVWAFGVRMYNYAGHGKGKDQRKAGSDFNTSDLSVNQLWPGYVAGEWHNNHHLFPNGVRSGFLSYQLDIPYWFVRFYSAIGGIASMRDYKDAFMRDYYEPYLAEKAMAKPAQLGQAEISILEPAPPASIT
jgi:sn-1 stearoyl-lipid 9-desaturase